MESTFSSGVSSQKDDLLINEGLGARWRHEPAFGSCLVVRRILVSEPFKTNGFCYCSAPGWQSILISTSQKLIQYSSWEHLPSNSDGPPPPTLHSPVVSFVLKVVFAKIVEALADSTRATEAGIVDSILSPNFDLGESLDARHLLAAMLHSPSQDDLTLFVMWLSRTHAPLTLIRAAYDNVESITTAQLMNLTRAQAEMFPFIVAAIGQVCMAQDDFGDHELLLKLCTYTFFKAVPMKGQVAESRMHWGLFDLVDTILMVTHAMPLPDPGSPLLDDLVRVRQVVCMLSLGTLRGSAFSLTAPASLNRSASASVSFDNRMESLLAEFKFIYDHATRSTARPRFSEENPAQGG
ncbi:hypothetical protein DFH07DRAFT_979517 [Mycena maculata]|uniref:Uncharacterized protein n=1 Tax=Mycena maculata TaxID=230809 RepID=A0AAD7IJL6_9AGAR|nr:hypothetical protein DFH07DRAFT_979517 [Mycena maculata]